MIKAIILSDSSNSLNYAEFTDNYFYRFALDNAYDRSYTHATVRSIKLQHIDTIFIDK